MRKFLLTLLSATLLAACGGGGSPNAGDALTAEQAQDMSVADIGDRLIDDSEELAELLATVDSEASARALEPRLDAMIADYRMLSERLENLDESDLSFGDAAALMRRAPKLATNAQAVAVQVERIQQDHPEASDILGRFLDEL